MTWLTYLKNIADWIRQLSDTVDKLTIAKLYQLLKPLPLFNTVTGYSLNSNQILKGKTAYANNIKVTGTRELSNSLVTNTFSYIISTGPLMDTNVCYPAYIGITVPIRFLDTQQYQICGYPQSTETIIFGQYSTAGNIILQLYGVFINQPEKYRLVSKYRVQFTHTEEPVLTGQYMYFPLDAYVFVLYNSTTCTIMWNDPTTGGFSAYSNGALVWGWNIGDYFLWHFNDDFLANKSFTHYSDSDGSVVFSMSLIQQPS